MSRIRLFHWRAAEAEPLIEQLQAGGYAVDYSGDNVLERPFRSMRESPPHAIVIDLTHLPSQGWHVAVAIRSKKILRNIPLVFVGGDPGKVERIRAELPDAIYTSRAKVGLALKRAKRVASPVSPPYSNRTTAQKLGIREGMRVAVMDVPRGYAKSVGSLPEAVSFEEDSADVAPVTLWFVRSPGVFLTALPRMRKLAGKSRLWVIYPKQKVRKNTPDEVSLFFIRDAALGVGLVHRKTCSLDATWAAMLLGPPKPVNTSGILASY